VRREMEETASNGQKKNRLWQSIKTDHG
jgi:hypothetical protein